MGRNINPLLQTCGEEQHQITRELLDQIQKYLDKKKTIALGSMVLSVDVAGGMNELRQTVCLTPLCLS